MGREEGGVDGYSGPPKVLHYIDKIVKTGPVTSVIHLAPSRAFTVHQHVLVCISERSKIPTMLLEANSFIPIHLHRAIRTVPLKNTVLCY